MKTSDNGEIEWSHNEMRMLKYMLEMDGIQFMRYFFKQRESANLLLNWHHYVMEYCLQAVIEMKIPRLIINLAPGYTKTEQSVINFISRGLAINPRSKFIHASYSGVLAQESSSKIKDTIEGEAYQAMWPMKVRRDKSGNAKWFTQYGGGMLAVSAGGQITGFRAGRMEDGFNGAFVIDDPVKPADAMSNSKRLTINNRFNNTIKSRLALETTPLVLMMQRTHEDDLAGFLLKGGSKEVWHHLIIPTQFTKEIMNAPYPTKYTHGKPIRLDEILHCMRTGKEYVF